MIKSLNEKMGITSRLRDHGVVLSDKLYKAAFEDPCHQSNPRTCSLSDFKRLFEEAY